MSRTCVCLLVVSKQRLWRVVVTGGEGEDWRWCEAVPYGAGWCASFADIPNPIDDAQSLHTHAYVRMTNCV